MGDLFWNKVAGSVLAVGLLILGLQTLSHQLVDAESPETLAYPVDLSEVQTASSTQAEPEDTGPVDFGALLASADVSAGERVARRCASCHSFEESGRNQTGPALYGVMGRDVGEVDGFRYSDAMIQYAGDGTEWMYQNMYEYLENPAGYVPGTAMSFAGLRDQEDRINVIAYMRAQDDNPPPLPEPLPEDSAPDSEAGGETDEAEDASMSENG